MTECSSKHRQNVTKTNMMHINLTMLGRESMHSMEKPSWLIGNTKRAMDFLNDGLSTKEANTEIVVGNHGKLYVKTTTWVTMHNEFFMSYGGPFWLDLIK